jgi:WhiB family redox-sensing transcriptional regulator
MSLGAGVDFVVDRGVDLDVGQDVVRPGDIDRSAHGLGPRDADFCTFSDSRRPILVTWRDRAACLDENPELFFPTGNADPAFRQIEQAKVVCRRCEVVQTCLRWAIGSLQDAGVWGGLSQDERHALKR